MNVDDWGKIGKVRGEKKKKKKKEKMGSKNGREIIFRLYVEILGNLAILRRKD